MVKIYDKQSNKYSYLSLFLLKKLKLQAKYQTPLRLSVPKQNNLCELYEVLIKTQLASGSKDMSNIEICWRNTHSYNVEVKSTGFLPGFSVLFSV